MKNRFETSIATMVLWILCGNLALFCAVQAQEEIVVAEFADGLGDFSPQNTLKADGFVWSADSGVAGDSGRLNLRGSGGHNDAVYYSGANASITKVYSNEYVASVYFLTGAKLTDQIAQVQVGFLRSKGSSFNKGQTTGCSVFGEFRNDGTGSYLRLYQTGTLLEKSDPVVLASDTWYELRTSLILMADDLASQIKVELFDRGPDGLATPRFMTRSTAQSVRLANGGFTGPSLWAGFGGGNHTGANVVAFDRFSMKAVPPAAASATP